MSEFSGVEAFVHTAEQRSFRKAAARLAVSPAAISKAVARLEARLGVRLLDRTSRKVALTPEGGAYLSHCRAALDELQAGRDKVSQAHRVPQGTLRISAPFTLGRALMSRLPRLTAAHPRLSFDLRLSDRLVSLHEEDVDVVVRIGALEDSALIARRLRSPRWVTVASPAYLARRGTPETLDDLQAHTCLKFTTPSGGVAEWQLADTRGAPGSTVRVPTSHRVDQGELLVVGAASGLGLAQVFDFLAVGPLASGRLVEVLADRAPGGPPVHALCRPGLQGAPRIEVFMDFLVETLAGVESR